MWTIPELVAEPSLSGPCQDRVHAPVDSLGKDSWVEQNVLGFLSLYTQCAQEQCIPDCPIIEVRQGRNGSKRRGRNDNGDVIGEVKVQKGRGLETRPISSDSQLRVDLVEIHQP